MGRPGWDRKTIEWTDETINPLPFQCKNKCSLNGEVYCYGYKKNFYKRLRWGTEPVLNLKCFERLPKHTHKMVFICSLHEIMGPWVPDEWIEAIIEECRKRPHLIFQFLTKNPLRYCDFLFPSNCWLGITATKSEDTQVFGNGGHITFISFEPLLHRIKEAQLWDSDWVIIGGLTGFKNGIIPKREWIEEIIETAKFMNPQVKIFIKDNLKDVWGDSLIQEWPR